MNYSNVGVYASPKQNGETAKNNPSLSKEEILSEYFQFLRNLPILPDLELNKVINTVKSEWGIDEILKRQVTKKTNDPVTLYMFLDWQRVVLFYFYFYF